jgi:5-formyltetrahydrofolate cyclo-ligase
MLFDAAHVPTLRPWGHDAQVTVPVDDLKNELRGRVRAARRARDEAARDEVDRLLAVRVGEISAVAALVDGSLQGCVAAYAAYGTEPRTGRLRALLELSGVRVLLPVIRDNGGLDWADDGGPLHDDGVSKGIPEPTSDVVARGMPGLVELGCRVILAPALAVDLHGHRIGKAGGYYDRLLAGLDDVAPSQRPIVVAVVHDDEVLDDIPVAAHDRPVDAALTPSGLRPLG